MYRQLQAGLIALWATSAVVAQDSGRFAAPAQAIAPQDVAVGSGFLQIFGSLLLVIATIVAVGWIARKLKALPRRSSGVFNVVDEVTLGGKERVVLLEVDGVRLVIGVGEGRVGLLHRSDMPAFDGQLDAPVGNRAESLASPRFIDLLKKGLGR